MQWQTKLLTSLWSFYPRRSSDTYRYCLAQHFASSRILFIIIISASLQLFCWAAAALIHHSRRRRRCWCCCCYCCCLHHPHTTCHRLLWLSKVDQLKSNLLHAFHVSLVNRTINRECNHQTGQIRPLKHTQSQTDSPGQPIDRFRETKTVIAGTESVRNEKLNTTTAIELLLRTVWERRTVLSGPTTAVKRKRVEGNLWRRV